MKRVMMVLYKLLWEFKLGSKTKNILRFKGYKWFHDLPKKYVVSPGEIVLHAGCWQIETIRRWSIGVGKNGKVIIVEANKYSYNILLTELELRKRKLSNVVIINKAAWNKKEKLVLEESDRPDSHKIKETKTQYETDIGRYISEDSVEADTISNILDELNVNHVDHFHLSINGAEVEAIDGIDSKFLKKGVRLFAYCETIMPENGFIATEHICNKLRKLGFLVVSHSHMPNQPDPIYGIIR